jgi:xylose isomerase
VKSYTTHNAKSLLAMDFDRKALADRPLPYEKLDQLVFDLLMGVR